MCLGDLKGHVGRHIDAFDGVHAACDMSEKFGRKNATNVLPEERIICAKCML